MIRLATLALVAAAALAAQPVRAQDGSELIVRMNRLEGQVRQMSGQIEQLQFDNRQLKEQLRKFQEDVEFRFQERAGGRTAAPAVTPPASATPRPTRRSDAFDPEGSPAAPGTPRQLGATPPSAPLAEGRRADTAFAEGEAAPLDLNAAARGGGSPAVASRPAAAAPSLPPAGGDARAEFDVAYAYMMQKQYPEADAAFRRFSANHARDRLAPDAIYWLGESLAQRNRHRDAAEQFLKVSTEHGKSGKAPDALYKLGVSLAALGAKDQACATLAEVERKYPAASVSLKQNVDREQKRVRCPA